MIDQKLYLFQSYYLWSQTFNNPVIEDEKIKLTSNFDYEMLFDGTKRVYVDVGLRTSQAETMYRSAFEFDGSEVTWSEVFTHDFILHLVDLAVDNSFEDYNLLCEQNNIAYPYDLEINKNIPESIAKDIIEKYVDYRSVSDVDNDYLINNIGLECESGTDTINTINCTFAIIDEIMLTHPSFNNEYNRKVFGDVVPLPHYFTLRMNCLLIEVNDVQLSIYDTIMFFLCLGCALQMMVGDNYELLLSAIKSKGITKRKSNAFIKDGTKLFAQLREMLERSNARFLDLENQPDWNSVIRLMAPK